MASRGEVILVPFPFTDLSTTQVRPAVVVSTDVYNVDTGDVICAMVTSQRHNLATDYELQDWHEAGLLFRSWGRAKIVSVEQSIIQHTIGRLSDRDLSEVDVRLRIAVGL